ASGRTGPFVAVDVAALPATLVAAELFGSTRGAFSDAVDRVGRLEAAHKGTLLLDEIGNLPLELQRMLLTAVESGRVTRLGESTARPVDVKLVAATNADLPAMVAAGTFRGDLYARLNPTARLEVPPLRARLGDLEELIAAFVRNAFAAGVDRALLAEYAAAAGIGGAAQRAEVAFGKPPAEPRAITFVVPQASLRAMRAYPWPGNVRELQLAVANATVFALADAAEAARTGRAATAAATRRRRGADLALARRLRCNGACDRKTVCCSRCAICAAWRPIASPTSSVAATRSARARWPSAPRPSASAPRTSASRRRWRRPKRATTRWRPRSTACKRPSRRCRPRPRRRRRPRRWRYRCPSRRHPARAGPWRSPASPSGSR